MVTALGYEHLRRHDLRHTGLTWMADAGVPVHVLRKIAGHGSHHHPALPTPRPAVVRRRRNDAERPLEGPPVPRWSPATRRRSGKSYYPSTN
ncbi:hypothetical protein NDQ86_08150 [Salinispora arenicola]|nr:tyrosine-type recombinase/integrase [Salinispora arenicola]MCN0152068.1 hypothetical protein [Salinispora arenicola]